MAPDEMMDPANRSQGEACPRHEQGSELLRAELRRGTLNFWDDALALREYIDRTGLSQSACARMLGRSQSGVANRLRLLKLSPAIRERMQLHGLSERHARALLRLDGEDARCLALDTILAGDLNVAQTEAYIDGCLTSTDAPSAAAAFAPLLTELERLRERVPDVEYRLSEGPDTIRFIILIPQKYDKT